MNLLSHRLEVVSSLIKEARLTPRLFKYIKSGARANNMSVLAYTRQLLKRRKAMQDVGARWSKSNNAIEWDPGASYGDIGGFNQTALQRHALLEHAPFFRGKSRHAVLSDLDDLGNRMSKYRATTTPPSTPPSVPPSTPPPVPPPTLPPIPTTSALTNNYEGLKATVAANPSLARGADRREFVESLLAARNELRKGNVYWSAEKGLPYIAVKDTRHYMNAQDMDGLRDVFSIPKHVKVEQVMHDLERLAARRAQLAATRTQRAVGSGSIDSTARFSELVEPAAKEFAEAAPSVGLAGITSRHPVLAMLATGAGGSFLGYKIKDNSSLANLRQEYANAQQLGYVK